MHTRSSIISFSPYLQEHMALRELLAMLEEGNELYYLTTQELKQDPKTGFVDVHAAPGMLGRPRTREMLA